MSYKSCYILQGAGGYVWRWLNGPYSEPSNMTTGTPTCPAMYSRTKYQAAFFCE